MLEDHKDLANKKKETANEELENHLKDTKEKIAQVQREAELKISQYNKQAKDEIEQAEQKAKAAENKAHDSNIKGLKSSHRHADDYSSMA